MTAVVDYNSGNVRSVMNALSRLGADAVLTADPDQIRRADRVIFPGVGAAASAMAELEKRGLTEVLREYERPFLGICLGMQLMNSFSEEGNVSLLGITPEHVRLFDRAAGDKIPHVGWNEIQVSDDPLFKGIADGTWFYFVHSYYAEASERTIASCSYAGVTFSSAIRKDNFRGVQFHPEKSGGAGALLLKNFLEVK